MVVYEADEAVIPTDLGSELFLLDPRTGEMFGLNDVGRHIWFALPVTSTARVADGITARFDVAHGVAHDDVRALLADLWCAGLVRMRGGDA